MVEIYLLIKWGRNLGAQCREAGLRSWRYQLLMVACWFGGEFFGIIVGIILAQILGIGEVGILLEYGFALFCASQAIKYPFRLVERELQRRTIEESQWICGSCGESVTTRDSVCPMCGSIRQPDEQFAGLSDTSSHPAADVSFLKPE